VVSVAVLAVAVLTACGTAAAPAPPPTTTTTTTTPAAVPTTTPPAVAFTATEAAYLAALDRDGIEYPDRVDIVRKGHALCESMRSGAEPDSLTDQILVKPYPDQEPADGVTYALTAGRAIVEAARLNLCRGT
jgi:hypothetical protein